MTNTANQAAPNVQRSTEVHEVIVVGSGAAGGMAAWNLTRQGVNVLMLDAGTRFRRTQFWSHVKPWEAREKAALGQKPPQFYVDTKEQPYLTDEKNPFELVRVWGRGGKTNVWAEFPCAIRMSILKARPRMAGRFPGPSATKTSHLTMTASSS